MPRNTKADAQWLSVLPSIADNCNYKIDKGHLQLLLSQFPDSNYVTFMASRMGSLPYNEFRDDWQIMFRENSQNACEIARRLWGEDGEMYPGVFRE